MPDTNAYVQSLLLSNPLREPLLREVIQALRLPPGSRGLDAGCGIGLQALLLAEAVGPTGHVTGLDLSPAFLARARGIAGKHSLGARTSFREGNIHRLPFDDNTFDWLWSVDCAGYRLVADPLRLVQELARVVRPGGRVAILVWSSQMLLPGYPLLEARLNATPSGTAPFTAGMRPESHYLRMLGWFREAGLQEPAAQTFVGSAHAPLSDDIRDGLADLLQMRWGSAESEASPEDWAAYQRLCQPGSPDFILDRGDYYAFFTYSLFHGRVAR